MSKKFRTLVGAIISASICSSCTSSGLPKVVKWGAAGITVAGGMYFGGRKFGLWGANRRRGVQSNNYISNVDGDSNLLGGNNDNDGAQLSNEEKVDICAEKIKGLVGENNYDKLKALYGKLQGNWGNVRNFFSFVNYNSEFASSANVAEVAKSYLKEMFELIFVSGVCGISERTYEDEVGFYVNILQCTFTIKFPEQGKVSIKVGDRRVGDTVLDVESI